MTYSDIALIVIFFFVLAFKAFDYYTIRQKANVSHELLVDLAVKVDRAECVAMFLLAERESIEWGQHIEDLKESEQYELIPNAKKQKAKWDKEYNERRSKLQEYKVFG